MNKTNSQTRYLKIKKSLILGRMREYIIPCRLSRCWFHRQLLFTNFSISFSIFLLKMDIVCLVFFISEEKENDGKTLWLDRNRTE